MLGHGKSGRRAVSGHTRRRPARRTTPGTRAGPVSAEDGRVTRHSRLLFGLLLAAYVVFLMAVLFQPSPDVASAVVGRVSDELVDLGVPESFAALSRVEFMLNAAMFAPLTLLAALTFPRQPWANWVVYAFVASAGVEFAQGLMVPLRSAQFVDVVANTYGALLGVLPAWVSRTVRSRDGR